MLLAREETENQLFDVFIGSRGFGSCLSIDPCWTEFSSLIDLILVIYRDVLFT